MVCLGDPQETHHRAHARSRNPILKDLNIEIKKICLSWNNNMIQKQNIRTTIGNMLITRQRKEKRWTAPTAVFKAKNP